MDQDQEGVVGTGGAEERERGAEDDHGNAEKNRLAVEEPEIEKSEGMAKFHYRKGEVFYNKAQVVNRDLSVLVIAGFVEARERELTAERDRRVHRREAWEVSMAAIGTAGNTTSGGHNASQDVGSIDSAGRHTSPTVLSHDEAAHHNDVTNEPQEVKDAEAEAKPRGVRILDALSATGLRALRYTLEVPGVDHVVANDLSSRAVASIRRNCELNGITGEQVSAVEGDALALMLRSAADNNLFDVIDLDPFGTPAPLLSAALHAVSNGGLLCVTCTDMRVLGGQQPDVCFARYGGMPIRAPYSKEAAIRIVLASLQSKASPLGKVAALYLSRFFKI